MALSTNMPINVNIPPAPNAGSRGGDRAEKARETQRKEQEQAVRDNDVRLTEDLARAQVRKAGETRRSEQTRFQPSATNTQATQTPRTEGRPQQTTQTEAHPESPSTQTIARPSETTQTGQTGAEAQSQEQGHPDQGQHNPNPNEPATLAKQFAQLTQGRPDRPLTPATPSTPPRPQATSSSQPSTPRPTPPQASTTPPPRPATQLTQTRPLPGRNALPRAQTTSGPSTARPGMPATGRTTVATRGAATQPQAVTPEGNQVPEGVVVPEGTGVAEAEQTTAREPGVYILSSGESDGANTGEAGNRTAALRYEVMLRGNTPTVPVHVPMAHQQGETLLSRLRNSSSRSENNPENEEEGTNHPVTSSVSNRTLALGFRREPMRG